MQSDEVKKYKAIFENSPEAIILLETNGDVTDINDRIRDLIGYDPDEIIGKNINNLPFLPVTSKSIIAKNLVKGLEGANILPYELEFSKLSGEIKTGLVSTSMIKNEAGKIIQVLVMVSDISERKKVNNKLQKQQNQLETIFSVSPDMLMLLDHNFVYRAVNPAFCKYMNLQEEDVIGKTDFDIFAFDEATVYRESDMKVIEVGEIQREERHIVGKDGTIRRFQIVKSPVTNSRGQPNGILISSRDITKNMEAEQALRDSEERYSGLANATFESVFISENGICIEANQMATEMFGYSYDEIIGIHGTEVIAPEHRDMVNKHMEMEYEEPYEAIALRKDGSTFYSNIRGKMTSYKGRNVRITVVRDIDEEVRVKRELSESELKYRMLYNTSRDAIMMLTPEDGFLAGNKATIELFGCKNEDEFIAREPASLSPHLQPNGLPSKDESMRMMKKALTTGSHSFEWKHKRMDGSEFDATVLLTKMTLQNQQVLQATVRDITETKLAQKELMDHRSSLEELVRQRTKELEDINVQLIEAKNKAEKSDKLKSAFLCNMSHEIRTPMNAIIGFSELLKDVENEENVKQEYLEIIINKGNLLLNIINDIIDISKVEANEIELNNTHCKVNILLDDLYRSYNSAKVLSKKSNIDLRLTKPETPDDIIVFSDPYRLKQILSNLIDNALKFTDEGFVEIGYSIVGKGSNTRLKFKVKDTGIGIPDDKLDIVYNRFHQLDDSSTRKFGGTGLGLTISKKLVELLGGEIGVESKLGKGSTFYFTIPYQNITIEKNAGSNDFQSTSSDDEYNWSDKNLLIVEDDPTSFFLLKTHLEKTRAGIIHAENGKDAVDHCKSNAEIDLVIMDIQLPELNGYDATKQIKKINKNLPVIAHTAYALPTEQEACFKAGCDDYVSKPVNSKRLLTLLNDYLKK
ncbi:MAG: PAS domain S-box protein [Bacteroidales bacterium]